jgi:glycosyltransferase involved in cell wall biosynthesis
LIDHFSILLLSRHAPQAASSRLRTFQFISHLEAAGAQVTVMPFFDQAYLDTLYRTGGRHLWNLARAYLRRVRTLADIHRFSIVWIEKELFPFFPSAAESILARLGVPYVVDYDDAIFHTYDQHRFSLVRALLGAKLDPLLQGAYAVTVGNSYLENYVRLHGGRNVIQIPTVVDIDRYTMLTEPPDEELRIGWIGTPRTAKYLNQLVEPLRQAAQTRKIRLVTIGAAPLIDFGIPLEQHPWSADAEARLLSSVHVGVMPLPDEPFERGKCGYKLIQYMACGRPVVASPIGVNVDIVTPDIGFTAANNGEWLTAFQRLGEDRNLRRRMGVAGRSRVERVYSVQAVAPKICELLAQAARAR